MTIQEIHNLFDLLADNDKTGYFTPAEKDVFIDRAQMWLYNDFRAIYAENSEAYEALTPFKKKLDYSTSSGGVLTVSSVSGDDLYMALLGLEVSVVDGGSARRFPVKVVKEDEITARRSSQILAPSATYPIAEETARGIFQFYPAQTHAGTIRYFRRPAKPVFAYTQSGRTITYNSGSSTQLEWGEPYHNKIVLKALQLAGLHLNDAVLQQLGLVLPKENI